MFPKTKLTPVEKELTIMPHGFGRKKFTVKEVIDRKHETEEIQKIDSVRVGFGSTSIIILILLGFLLFRSRK